MSRRIYVAPTLALLRLRRPAAGLFLGLSLLFAQPAGHAQLPDALSFSRGFLVKGDYVAGGVDLVPGTASNGVVTGMIPMTGVPANADILAAYLYWETISTATSQMLNVKFRGAPVSVARIASTRRWPLASVPAVDRGRHTR